MDSMRDHGKACYFWPSVWRNWHVNLGSTAVSEAVKQVIMESQSGWWMERLGHCLCPYTLTSMVWVSIYFPSGAHSIV